MKQSIFREYDIRGIADQELLSPDVELLGQALGTYIQRKAGKNINLGRDCRLSGDRLMEALRKGLGVYLESFTNPDARAAIRLTLISAAIAVPLTLLFDTKGREVARFEGRIAPEAWDGVAELLP